MNVIYERTAIGQPDKRIGALNELTREKEMKGNEKNI